jgi:hypothetical protein
MGRERKFYGKKGKFLHVDFGIARECIEWSLKETIVGMCGSCLELKIHKEVGC